MPNKLMPTPLLGIYVIKNLVTNRVYIGDSGDVEFRMTNHWNQLVAGIHSNKDLQADWNRYGMANFSLTFIQTEANFDKRKDAEKDWIDRAVKAGRALYNRNLERDDGKDWR